MINAGSLKLGVIGQRLRAKIKPTLLMARLDLSVGSPEEDLKGRRGTVRLYNNIQPDGTEVVDADVCCPGCGEGVFHLTPEDYPLRRDPLLSCRVPIHFVACCGWYGTLGHGVWKGR